MLKKTFYSFFVCLFLFVDLLPASPALWKTKVPSHLGEITHRYKGEVNRLIIHIQDHHTNLDAQINLAKIIRYLQDYHKDQKPLVGIEGNYQEYSLSTARKNPYAKINEQVVVDYLQKGELLGAEASVLISDDDFSLVGLEEEKIFKEHIKDYQSILSDKESIQNTLNQISQRVLRLKEKVYSEELLAFSKKEEDFRSQKDSFEDFFQTYIKYSNQYQLSLTPYVSLVSLIENLQDQEENKGNTLQRVDLDVWYDFLDSIVQLKVKMASSQNAKKFVLLETEYDLLEKAYSFELTPQDLDLLPSSWGMQDFLSRLAEFQDEITITSDEMTKIAWDTKWDQSAKGFYEKAKKRDVHLVENLLAEMDKTQTQTGILVAGGFHTKGIQEILQEKKVSYLVIRPQYQSEQEIRSVLEKQIGSFEPQTKTSLIQTGKLAFLTASRFVSNKFYFEKILQNFSDDALKEFLVNFDSVGRLVPDAEIPAAKYDEWILLKRAAEILHEQIYLLLSIYSEDKEIDPLLFSNEVKKSALIEIINSKIREDSFHLSDVLGEIDPAEVEGVEFYLHYVDAWQKQFLKKIGYQEKNPYRLFLTDDPKEKLKKKKRKEALSVLKAIFHYFGDYDFFPKYRTIEKNNILRELNQNQDRLLKFLNVKEKLSVYQIAKTFREMSNLLDELMAVHGDVMEDYKNFSSFQNMCHYHQDILSLLLDYMKSDDRFLDRELIELWDKIKTPLSKKQEITHPFIESINKDLNGLRILYADLRDIQLAAFHSPKLSLKEASSKGAGAPKGKKALLSEEELRLEKNRYQRDVLQVLEKQLQNTRYYFVRFEVDSQMEESGLFTIKANEYQNYLNSFDFQIELEDRLLNEEEIDFIRQHLNAVLLRLNDLVELSRRAQSAEITVELEKILQSWQVLKTGFFQHISELNYVKDYQNDTEGYFYFEPLALSVKMLLESRGLSVPQNFVERFVLVLEKISSYTMSQEGKLLLESILRLDRVLDWDIFTDSQVVASMIQTVSIESPEKIEFWLDLFEKISHPDLHHPWNIEHLTGEELLEVIEGLEWKKKNRSLVNEDDLFEAMDLYLKKKQEISEDIMKRSIGILEPYFSDENDLLSFLNELAYRHDDQHLILITNELANFYRFVQRNARLGDLHFFDELVKRLLNKETENKKKFDLAADVFLQLSDMFHEILVALQDIPNKINERTLGERDYARIEYQLGEKEDAILFYEKLLKQKIREFDAISDFYRHKDHFELRKSFSEISYRGATDLSRYLAGHFQADLDKPILEDKNDKRKVGQEELLMMFLVDFLDRQMAILDQFIEDANLSTKSLRQNISEIRSLRSDLEIFQNMISDDNLISAESLWQDYQMILDQYRYFFSEIERLPIKEMTSKEDHEKVLARAFVLRSREILGLKEAKNIFKVRKKQRFLDLFRYGKIIGVSAADRLSKNIEESSFFASYQFPTRTEFHSDKLIRRGEQYEFNPYPYYPQVPHINHKSAMVLGDYMQVLENYYIGFIHALKESSLDQFAKEQLDEKYLNLRVIFRTYPHSLYYQPSPITDLQKEAASLKEFDEVKHNPKAMQKLLLLRSYLYFLSEYIQGREEISLHVLKQLLSEQIDKKYQDLLEKNWPNFLELYRHEKNAARIVTAFEEMLFFRSDYLDPDNSHFDNIVLTLLLDPEKDRRLHLLLDLITYAKKKELTFAQAVERMTLLNQWIYDYHTSVFEVLKVIAPDWKIKSLTRERFYKKLLSKEKYKEVFDKLLDISFHLSFDYANQKRLHPIELFILARKYADENNVERPYQSFVEDYVQPYREGKEERLSGFYFSVTDYFISFLETKYEEWIAKLKDLLPQDFHNLPLLQPVDTASGIQALQQTYVTFQDFQSPVSRQRLLHALLGQLAQVKRYIDFFVTARLDKVPEFKDIFVDMTMTLLEIRYMAEAIRFHFQAAHAVYQDVLSKYGKNNSPSLLNIEQVLDLKYLRKSKAKLIDYMPLPKDLSEFGRFDQGRPPEITTSKLIGRASLSEPAKTQLPPDTDPLVSLVERVEINFISQNVWPYQEETYLTRQLQQLIEKTLFRFWDSELLREDYPDIKQKLKTIRSLEFYTIDQEHQLAKEDWIEIEGEVPIRAFRRFFPESGILQVYTTKQYFDKLRERREEKGDPLQILFLEEIVEFPGEDSHKRAIRLLKELAYLDANESDSLGIKESLTEHLFSMAAKLNKIQMKDLLSEFKRQKESDFEKWQSSLSAEIEESLAFLFAVLEEIQSFQIRAVHSYDLLRMTKALILEREAYLGTSLRQFELQKESHLRSHGVVVLPSQEDPEGLSDFELKQFQLLSQKIGFEIRFEIDEVKVDAYDYVFSFRVEEKKGLDPGVHQIILGSREVAGELNYKREALINHLEMVMKILLAEYQIQEQVVWQAENFFPGVMKLSADLKQVMRQIYEKKQPAIIAQAA